MIFCPALDIEEAVVTVAMLVLPGDAPPRADNVEIIVSGEKGVRGGDVDVDALSRGC